MNTNTTPAQINPANVRAVYAGKAGTCCCGCAGVHTYASAHREASSERRGYAVEDNEVSDEVVARIVDIINIRGDIRDDGDDFAAIEVDGRLYVAYFAQTPAARRGKGRPVSMDGTFHAPRIPSGPVIELPPPATGVLATLTNLARRNAPTDYFAFALALSLAQQMEAN